MITSQRKISLPPSSSEKFTVFCEAGSGRVLDLALALIAQDYDIGEHTGFHRHEDFYALYIVTGGRGVHVINGHPYNITRGDVYIALPGSTHAYRDYENLRADCFCFTTDLFGADEMEALRSLPGLWSLQIDADGGAPGENVRNHRLHLPPERHREIEAMVAELGREAARAAANESIARIMMPALFFRLLVNLARAGQEEGHEARSAALPSTSALISHEAGLARVLRVCEERFAQPLSVPELAALMFLSPGRFSEVFSAHMGVAPASYLRRLRLERAQTLLRGTDLTVAVIAAQVGFNDAAQFSRAFHGAFAVTPMAYRIRFRE